jgi:DNA polymerase-3 subunit epsilon
MLPQRQLQRYGHHAKLFYNKTDKLRLRCVVPSYEKYAAHLPFSCYNAYRLDIPMLMEEFIRADVDFDMKGRKVVDVQKIFHQMEQRTLSAAYKFYCNKSLEGAHGAEVDAVATAEILNAQLEKYPQLGTNIDSIIKAIGEEPIIDFARRFIFNDKGVEVFNFGKHKGRPVADVLKAEPQYYDWMMKGEFPMNTKQKLTEMYTRIMLKKF